MHGTGTKNNRDMILECLGGGYVVCVIHGLPSPKLPDMLVCLNIMNSVRSRLDSF